MVVKKEKTTKKEKKIEPDLPSKEDARQAFTAALDPRQERVRTILQRIASDPPQVLIIEGGLANERFSMALWYAALINCKSETRPCLHCNVCLQTGAQILLDLKVLKEEGQEDEDDLKIGSIRKLRQISKETSRGEDIRRVAILVEAQHLTTEAANALLKVMEEPGPTVFVLLTPQRQNLLPTLVSRGWTITLAWPEPIIDTEMQAWSAVLDQFLADGRGWFAKTSGKGAVDANLAKNVILLIQKSLADVMGQRANTGGLAGRLNTLSDRQKFALQDILAQSQASLDYSVNPGLVLEWLATQVYSFHHQAACRTNISISPPAATLRNER